MARYGCEDFGCGMMRDGRGRDLREMHREQDPRDRLDGREQRRIDPRDLAQRGYGDFDPEMMRDGRGRDPRDRPDEREHCRINPQDLDHRDDSRERQRPDHRDDSRGRQRPDHRDDSRERQRPSIDLQSRRREEPSSRYQEYFLPGEGIAREVAQLDICRYLGNDATVRPYVHQDVGCHWLPYPYLG
jgi:hypothetical protein